MAIAVKTSENKHKFFDRPAKSASVVIKRDSPKNLYEWFDQYFETLILNKRDEFGYYNNVNGNRRIFSALFVTVWIAVFGLTASATGIVIYLNSCGPDCNATSNVKLDFGDVTTVVALLMGTWLGIFWKEKNQLYSKWQYLAGLYNSIASTPIEKSEAAHTRDIMNVGLAIDTLRMEMWSHSSFSDLFHDTLYDAIHEVCTPDTFSTLYSASLTTTGIRYSEAEFLLNEYQQVLFGRIEENK